MARFKDITFNIRHGRISVLAIGLNLKFDPSSPNIPAKSSFTNLIVVHNYVNSGHLSTYYARSKLTNSFLIPNDKPILQSVLIK